MPRTSWLVAGAAALCAVPLSSEPSRADALHATREQALAEVSHTVDITLADGVAIYRVRRVFANAGKVADEAGLAIDLPSGAAATGLRIRAHDRWYDGDLMERGAAAARYQELTGLGAYRPKDPALLQWLWADKLYLQVFPVMPGDASTVEYTLTVPTRYDNGRYWLSYPRVDAERSDGSSLPLAAPVITVHPAWAASRPAVWIDGRRTLADTPVVLLPPEVQPWQAQIADPSASYVASAIDVPASSHTTGEIATATIDVAITHTYIGDLRVELITPQGAAVVLHDRTGGTTNNLRLARDVALPAHTTAAGTWRLIVSDHAGLDTGSLDSWSLDVGDTRLAATDTPVFIPDAPETASDAGVAAIAVAAPDAQPTWTVRVGRAVASDHHAFTRLEIDAARELVPTPHRAQLVFVVDASYSVGAAGLAAQLAVVRSYVGQLPDAEVEVVAYRRRADRVFGRFVPAADLAKQLAAATARGALALGNGSSLDDGAKLAASLIGARAGARRVVLLTDELTRTALTPAAAVAALAALPRDVIVHVVVPRLDGDDRVSLVRRDDADLAALATAHHGIYADLDGAPAEPTKQLEPVVLELVRPTRIDHLAVTGLTDDADSPQVPELLHEGDGVRAMWLRPTAPSHLVVTGRLWSDPIRADVAASAVFSQQTAALVFGADADSDLSEDEQLHLAFAGRAVSRVTSYVAAEPGTRPSPIGLDFGRSGFGVGGGGAGYGAGYGDGRGRPPLDLKQLVDADACLDQLPAADVVLGVETTRDEIVDVAIEGVASPLAGCLVEAVWRTRLDDRFALDRDNFHVVWKAR
jgi:subtilisin-like proprotein convertase family protein